MKKIKGLLPSQRERKRYISFIIKSTAKHSQETLKNTIRNQLINFLGEYGYAQAGIDILTESNTQGIIRVNNRFISETITGLSMINKINAKEVHIQTVKTSGILSKTRKTLRRAM